MSTKHSPGPWRWDSVAENRAMLANPGPSAPELLAALEAAAHALDKAAGWLGDGELGDYLDSEEAKLRVLIARVKGTP